MVIDIIFKTFLGAFIIAFAVETYRNPAATNTKWFPWLASRTWGKRALRTLATVWVFGGIGIIISGLAPLIFYGVDSPQRFIAAVIIATVGTFVVLRGNR